MSYGVSDGDTILFDEFHYSLAEENSECKEDEPMNGLEWIDDLVDFSNGDDPGEISIILQNKQTNETFPFTIDPTRKIGKFKQKMRKKSDSVMQMKSIKLIYKGTTMMNRKAWNEYGINDGDVVLFAEYQQSELEEYDVQKDKILFKPVPIAESSAEDDNDIEMKDKQKRESSSFFAGFCNG